MIGRRDARLMLLLAALPVLLLAPTLFTGRVYFLNDLTHISHPWRVLCAELLQRGQLPLWNPYAYFGLPLAGNMQAAPFDPLAAVFHFFPFARALSPFLLLAYWLGTFFAYLWLRRLGSSPGAAAGGAALFAAGGAVACQIQFPNILAALAWGPALFLFAGRLLPAALAGACGFLAGYPPVWAGFVAAWLALQAAVETRSGWLRSAAAAALALGVAGVALLPGLELSRTSSRAEGIPISERLVQSMDLADLWSVVHPEITRAVEAHGRARQLERVVWTNGAHETTFSFTAPAGGEHVANAAGARYSHLLSAYVGVAGALAALAGLVLLARRSPWRALAVAAFIAAVLAACLGGTYAATTWLWTHAPYLRQLRGPARLNYLLLAVMPVLVALGLHHAGRRRPLLAGAWAALLLVELTATSWAFYPTLGADYYTQRGRLAGFLQQRLEGLRYFMIPEVEGWPHVGRTSGDPRFPRFRELTYRTYKEKLFGLANLPYHLEAAAGGYEPLVPAGVDRVVRALRASQETAGLADRLAWLGCRFVLARGELAPYLIGHEAALLPGRVLDRGSFLWSVYEAPGAARARWLDEEEGGRLENTVERAGPPAGVPVEARRPREDQLVLDGESPARGRLFIAEPFYPGWKAYVNGSAAPLEKALGAFLQVRVPKGPWRVRLRYEPASFVVGAWLTLVSLALLAALSLRLHRRSHFQ